MSSKTDIKSYGRFKGLPWFSTMANSIAFVGGAGGIGSHLVFQLARTGANVVVVDDDVVEEENLAGQLYGPGQIGKPKVEALAEVVHSLCSEALVTPIKERLGTDMAIGWKEMVRNSNVVCVGFDNLKARKIVYDYWKEEGLEDSFFVDGRLAAESMQIFCVPRASHGSVFKQYEGTYFSTEERVELPCTMKATTHCGAIIAGMMVSQITNWMNNQLSGTLPRSVLNVELHLPLGLFELSVFEPKVESNDSHVIDDGGGGQPEDRLISC